MLTLQAHNPKICGISYLYGSLKEILTILQTWAQNPTKKCLRYPIVMLIEDFPVNNTNAYYSQAKLNIIIATDTTLTYSSAERQINTFDPVLTPIYNELMSQIGKCPFFVVYNPQKDMPHSKIEHKLWNKSKDKTEIGDYIDAIEIKGLTLKLEQQC